MMESNKTSENKINASFSERILESNFSLVLYRAPNLKNWREKTKEGLGELESLTPTGAKKLTHTLPHLNIYILGEEWAQKSFF